MANDNSFSITGTIYKKEFTEVKGVKKPTETYSKYLITLEVTSSRTYTIQGKEKVFTSTQLPQFEFFGINLDEFEKGDLVEVRFYLQGKEYTKQNGEKAIFTKPVGTFMKFGDLDAGHKSHRGKIKIDSMSNADDLPQPKRENVFVAPDPDGEDFGDLPFILTALIGIGSMFII
jgi:hypothetical protein